jgi:hypothetical protein
LIKASGHRKFTRGISASCKDRCKDTSYNLLGGVMSIHRHWNPFGSIEFARKSLGK